MSGNSTAAGAARLKRNCKGFFFQRCILVAILLHVSFMLFVLPNLDASLLMQNSNPTKSSPSLQIDESFMSAAAATVRKSTANEPYVMLHVGPHKTGTTSVQRTIYLNSTQVILLRDNIVVPNERDLSAGYFDIPSLVFAHCAIRNLKKGGGELNWALCRKALTQFEIFINEAYKNSRNVLIVAEDLDRSTIFYSRVLDLLRPYTDVRVVVSYRRLHDWLPSWYNQIMSLYMPDYAKGNQPFPSFVDWLAGNYEDFLNVHAIEVMKRYKENGFEKVDLINFHESTEGDNLIEHFFCHHIPGALHTCQAIRNGTIAKPEAKNVGAMHEDQRIAIAAAQRGLIPFNITRVFFANRIKEAMFGLLKYHTNGTMTIVDFPKICPPEDFMEELIRVEQRLEVEHFPDWHQMQGGQKGLQKAFDKAASKKFCSVDLDALFNSSVLEPIFAELKDCDFSLSQRCWSKWETRTGRKKRVGT